MSTPNTNASAGTTITPPPSPVSDPRNPAITETAPTIKVNEPAVIKNSRKIPGLPGCYPVSKLDNNRADLEFPILAALGFQILDSQCRKKFEVCPVVI